MNRRLVTLLLVSFVLAGCRLAAEPAQATFTSPAANPTFALEAESIPPGDYELSLGEAEDTREVILHIPPAYDGSLKLPLLVVLHGGGGSAKQIHQYTEMDSAADEYGFVVVYPNGSGRLGDSVLTWNSGHCCEYARTHQVDDVAFLSLLIERMLSHYSIDPARVYLAGISNGGMLAYRAGAELADKVAAIAPIAATIGGRVSEGEFELVPVTPGTPVSVIAFHGLLDQHVLYAGGVAPEALDAGRVDLSVETSISFWLNANGCDLQPEIETLAAGNVVIDTYGGCEAGTEVVLVTIVDGGHAWPGARQRLVGDDPTQDISANEMMLEFFLAHPKLSN